MRVAVALIFVLVAVGCGSDDDAATDSALSVARGACVAAAEGDGSACDRDCSRFGEDGGAAGCNADCEVAAAQRIDACSIADDPALVDCDGRESCSGDVAACREAAAQSDTVCRDGCRDGSGALRCLIACDRELAASEAACGFVAVAAEDGHPELPELVTGRAADLSVLLDRDEIAVVEAADARAESIRKRPLRLGLDAPGARVRISQVRHDFVFGFPMDFREFRDAPEDLAEYREMARANTSLMVAETSLKWRNSEPRRGELSFDLADDELAWAEDNGFDVKAHVLLWGNAPPFSTGSGVPDWLLARFPDPQLTSAERAELTELIRLRVRDIVGRYRGRIDVWDVTNETLNIFTPWFAERLPPEIVNEIFAWTRAADPGAQLVFNEWITEVFTGLPGPSAADVRDRVLELLAAGVPIDAVGQQGHFVPGIIFAGGEADLSVRTRVDDYAEALDTLASTGLPVHITEVTFNAPAEPEARAAQAEAMMRLWWGHESVEEVIFWSLWNKVAARGQLNHGVFDDDGVPTRHGEAILSLVNDRWRTDVELTADEGGFVEIPAATLGQYVALWEDGGRARSARFDLGGGQGRLTVAVVGDP